MKHPLPLERPTKQQISALPPYDSLPLDRIHVPRGAEDFSFAARELRESGAVGFDTESKPVFVAGMPQNGPDIVQLASAKHAFIVQLSQPEALPFLREVIESRDIVKVGFGLVSDRGPLYQRLGLELQAAIDLALVVRRLGYREAVGIKAAVAIVLGQRLQKSRSATTSNWASPELSAKQLRYAADDAHAALLVYRALAARGIDLTPPRDHRRDGAAITPSN